MQKSKFNFYHVLVFIMLAGILTASITTGTTIAQTPSKPTCKPPVNEKAPFSVMDLIHSNAGTATKVNQKISPACDGNQVQIAEYVRRIFCDSKVNYWLGTNALGVARYTAGEGTYFSIDKGLGGTQVTGIIEDTEGKIWVANSGGVAVIKGDRVTNYSKAAGLQNPRLWCIMQDSKGTIWVGGEDGVYRFDGVRFHPFSLGYCKSPEETESAKPLRVSSLMEDSQGNIWIGTEGKGAIKYDGQKFTYFNMDQGLVDNHIVCILEDQKGNMWFSSRFHGLGYYDGKTFTNFSTATGLGNDECWNMLEDKEGNIWFSSEGFGVYKYNGKTFENFSVKEGLEVKAVQTIYQDHNDKIWVGGGGGLFRLEGDKFINITRKGPWDNC
ncbi:MAG: hypothetical protein KDC24_13840 [Saprospiraceae bacterium]|nr:hypothetical protein [Saprospiraceae bacterium]